MLTSARSAQESLAAELSAARAAEAEAQAALAAANAAKAAHAEQVDASGQAQLEELAALRLSSREAEQALAVVSAEKEAIARTLSQRERLLKNDEVVFVAQRMEVQVREGTTITDHATAACSGSFHPDGLLEYDCRCTSSWRSGRMPS